VGYASIPDGSGTIHGCYKTAGTSHELKVIDTAHTTHCPAGYTSLNWSQTGPTGATGATGAQGPQGTPATQCEVTDATTPASYTDLQAALNSATSGDTLDITGECTGDYTDNLANVSLVGAPTAELTWGGTSYAGLIVGANDNATITNLLITGSGNGFSSPLVTLTGSTVTLNGDSQVNNSQSTNGGIDNGGNLIMNDNSQVDDNTWSYYGGGIRMENGSTLLMNDNSQVDGNSNAIGNGYGGAAIYGFLGTGLVQLTGNAQVENNSEPYASPMIANNTVESCAWTGAVTPNNGVPVSGITPYNTCT
jgi:hypothetical protein